MYRSIFRVENPDYVVDHFAVTPEMSTFSLGFVISQMTEITKSESAESLNPEVRIWARPEFHSELQVTFFQRFSFMNYKSKISKCREFMRKFKRSSNQLRTIGALSYH